MYFCSLVRDRERRQHQSTPINPTAMVADQISQMVRKTTSTASTGIRVFIVLHRYFFVIIFVWFLFGPWYVGGFAIRVFKRMWLFTRSSCFAPSASNFSLGRSPSQRMWRVHRHHRLAEYLHESWAIRFWFAAIFFQALNLPSILKASKDSASIWFVSFLLSKIFNARALLRHDIWYRSGPSSHARTIYYLSLRWMIY
jgi:hypothetical protein